MTARQRQVPGAGRRLHAGGEETPPTGVSESLHTLATDPCLPPTAPQTRPETQRVRVPAATSRPPRPTRQLQGGPECRPPRPKPARLTRPQPYPGVPGPPQPRHCSPPNHSDDHYQHQGAGWSTGTRSVCHSAPLSEPLTREDGRPSSDLKRPLEAQAGQLSASLVGRWPTRRPISLHLAYLPSSSSAPGPRGWRRSSPSAAAQSPAPRPAHGQRMCAVHLATGEQPSGLTNLQVTPEFILIL